MDTVRLPDASSAVAAVSHRYGNRMEDKMFFAPPPHTHTQKNMHKNTHPHCDVTGTSYIEATPVCWSLPVTVTTLQMMVKQHTHSCSLTHRLDHPYLGGVQQSGGEQQEAEGRHVTD